MRHPEITSVQRPQSDALDNDDTADARSCVVRLLPAGRRTIEEAAPFHVDHVRQDFIDLLTPAELDTLIAVNERVLSHLADGSDKPDD